MIRLALQLYLILGFAAILNGTEAHVSNYSDAVSLFVATLSAILFLLTPIYFTIVLAQK